VSCSLAMSGISAAVLMNQQYAKIFKASALRMRMPSPAHRTVPTIIAMGVARPNAQVQAMMRTATALTRAWAQCGHGP
jgi:hypothetical protein